MAVKTIWIIEHVCGHTVSTDLSDYRADERAGFARWLGSRDCNPCWRAQRDEIERRAREAWLAATRVKETAAIDAWETARSMPTLTGSDRAVEWARRCRTDLLSCAYEQLVLAGELVEEHWAERIEAPARRLTQAAWWINQRDSGPENLEELIGAGICGLDQLSEVET